MKENSAEFAKLNFLLQVNVLHIYYSRLNLTYVIVMNVSCVCMYVSVRDQAFEQAIACRGERRAREVPGL